MEKQWSTAKHTNRSNVPVRVKWKKLHRQNMARVEAHGKEKEKNQFEEITILI